MQEPRREALKGRKPGKKSEKELREEARKQTEFEAVTKYLQQKADGLDVAKVREMLSSLLVVDAEDIRKAASEMFTKEAILQAKEAKEPMSAKEAVQATEYGLGVLDAAIKLLQDSAVNQTNLVYHVPLAEKSGTVLVGTPTDVFKLPEYDTVQIHSKMLKESSRFRSTRLENYREFDRKRGNRSRVNGLHELARTVPCQLTQYRGLIPETLEVCAPLTGSKLVLAAEDAGRKALSLLEETDGMIAGFPKAESLDKLGIVRPPLLATGSAEPIAEELRENLLAEDLDLSPTNPIRNWELIDGYAKKVIGTGSLCTQPEVVPIGYVALVSHLRRPRQ